MTPVITIQAKHLCKSYSQGGTKIDVPRGTLLDVDARQLTLCVGSSGSEPFFPASGLGTGIFNGHTPEDNSPHPSKKNKI